MKFNHYITTFAPDAGPIRGTSKPAADSQQFVARCTTILIISLLCSLPTVAQQRLTLSDAIEIAQQKSRNIKKSKLNLYSNQRSLDAQRAALKSRFALDITPFDYNRNRSFNDLFSTWNTNE